MSGIAVYPQQEDGFVRKKWRVEECRQLTQNGLLSPGRYELIEGEILEKMGQGRIHIFVVGRIIAILSAIFGGDSIQSQAQIGIGAVDPHNDPEPDVAVLQGHPPRLPEPRTRPRNRSPAGSRSVPYYPARRHHHESTPLQHPRHPRILGGRHPAQRTDRLPTTHPKRIRPHTELPIDRFCCTSIRADCHDTDSQPATLTNSVSD